MVTIRSLTAAIRVDASGMQADLEKGKEKIRAWQSDVRRLNAQARKMEAGGDVAGADRARQIAAGLSERRDTMKEEVEARAALQERLKIVKAAKEQERRDRQEMEDRMLAATQGRQALELRNLDRHYAAMRERHKDNVGMMKQIDAAHAAERARVADRGGMVGWAERAQKLIAPAAVITGASAAFGLGEGLLAGMRGNAEKAAEAVQRLPFGIGSALVSFSGFFAELSGYAAAYERDRKNSIATMKRQQETRAAEIDTATAMEDSQNYVRRLGMSDRDREIDIEKQRYAESLRQQEERDRRRYGEYRRTEHAYDALKEEHEARRREIEQRHSRLAREEAERALRERERMEQDVQDSMAAAMDSSAQDHVRRREEEIRKERELRDLRIQIQSDGEDRPGAMLASRHEEEKRLAKLHGADLVHLAERQAMERQIVERDAMREHADAAAAEFERLFGANAVDDSLGRRPRPSGPGQFSTAYGARVNVASLAGQFGNDPILASNRKQETIMQQMLLVLQQMVGGMLS